MIINIETERLLIRNIEITDYKDAFKWCGDPEVNTYMIYPVYQKAEDVREWINSIDVESENECEVVFVLKENGAVIGGGGIHYSQEEDAWEIGYNLARAYWGHGYTVEAMQSLISYVRNSRDVKAIEGTFCVDNLNSRRVMEKLGMSYYRDTEYSKLDGSRRFKAMVFRKSDWFQKEPMRAMSRKC